MTTLRALSGFLAPRHLGLPALAFALALSGCAGTPRQVESVARTDLGCDQVTIAEIAKNRYAASGCGKGGVYAQLCGEGPCSWVRLRGAEPAQPSSGGAAPAQPREIIPAPPPEQRQVIQAPPPAQREIIPAPPPAAGESSSTAPVDTTPTASDNQTPQTSLANGDLSQPYQAQVPLTPAAQQVEYPPPAPLVEQRPPPPAPSYQWVGGYWNWSNANWLWAPGYWTSPMYGYNYVPGSWYYANNYWYYGPGGWARPNSTYIAYGVGPRPYGYAYTRSFTPRVHSAYPGRVGAQPAHQGFGGPSSRSGFIPQRSPLYGGAGGSASGGHSSGGRYPSSATSPLGNGPARMGTMRASPGGGGSFGGSSPAYSAPGRFGSGPSHSDFRSPSMGRAPSSAPSPSFAPSRAPSMGHSGGGGFGGGGGGGPGRSGAGPMRSGGGGIRR